jgi:TP901 family phage tail tape measure protein
MSTTLALLLQITASNGAAGVLTALKNSLVDVNRLSKEANQHFADMTRHLANAGKGFAGALYLKGKLEPGVTAAGNLEEAMLNVKGSIAQVGDNADDLAKKLQRVRDTGREVSKVMPFSATEVVQIQGALLKSGVDINAVTGAHGAAYAAAGLATISGVAPADVGDMLARIGMQNHFKPQDYASAADLLMKGEAASPGSLQELLYSLKQSGFSAAALGVSFRDQVTMASALAPLGLESGTAINRYMLDSAGLTKHQREAMVNLGLGSLAPDGKFQNHMFKDGKYIGLEAENALVRSAFDRVKGGDQAKMQLAHAIWGQEGMRAALGVAGIGGQADLFGEMRKQMDLSLGMKERMDIRMGGLNMSKLAASGTAQTALAQLFEPVLKTLAAAANRFNDLADGFAKWLANHPTANKALAYGGGALVAGGAAYGLVNLIKAASSGAAFVKSLASSASGIAQGMAVQAATGVTPVFVTNWQGTGVLGLPGNGEVPALLKKPVPGAGNAGLLGLVLGSGAALAGASSLLLAGDSRDQSAAAARMHHLVEELHQAEGGRRLMKHKDYDSYDKVANKAEQDALIKRLAEEIAKMKISVQVDGKEVATTVNEHNARDAKRH